MFIGLTLPLCQFGFQQPERLVNETTDLHFVFDYCEQLLAQTSFHLAQFPVGLLTSFHN